MAKMIEVSQAEYEMLVEAYTRDGITIARMEKELADAKSAISRLLVLTDMYDGCDFCRHKPGEVACDDCRKNAEWNGRADNDDSIKGQGRAV